MKMQVKLIAQKQKDLQNPSKIVLLIIYYWYLVLQFIGELYRLPMSN